MSNLLDKFAKVKVSAAERIASDDAAWCEGEQTNYQRAHKLYTEFRNDATEAMQIEVKEWSERNENSHNSYQYIESYGDGGLSGIDKRIKEIQNNFIHAIMYHFSRKYNVEIGNFTIEKNLGFIPPERSYSNSQWEREQEEYRVKSSRLLHYNEIVDEILLQLGGLTFADKAVQQIKDNAKEAAHDQYHSKCYYTVNKKMIQFEEWFTRWDKNHHAVLLALWHFRTGTTSMAGSWWQRKFQKSHSYYSEDERVGSPFEFEDGNIRKMRYFKNGRWDITFESEQFADTFARDYLGY